MRQRLITAFFLLAFFVPLVFYGNSWLFLAILVLLLAIAANEWAHLLGLRWPFSWAILSVAAYLIAVIFWPTAGLWPAYLAFACIAFWLFVLMLILFVQARATLSRRLLQGSAWPVLLPAFWFAFYLQNRHPLLLLWGLSIIVMTDVAAMMAGKRFGKARLVPKLSPGKTWAGLWGGLLGGVLVGTLGGGWLWSWQFGTVLLGAALGLVVAAFGVLGDLFESLLKRSAGKKDSGQLLPGHGGILDRIDAMTAGLPIFVSLLVCWGKL
ncbi:phosphatidate cytidylyltransferase [Acidithiobacillus sp. IBUN Pt1247-S3]|uniref:phosphatidate cytidylyltransferase n=1 Tax=Acidithiobacillus sp. IBUN Pt1247-S3 TaxID=3166642 RepID=UPI0034E46E22